MYPPLTDLASNYVSNRSICRRVHDSPPSSSEPPMVTVPGGAAIFGSFKTPQPILTIYRMCRRRSESERQKASASRPGEAKRQRKRRKAIKTVRFNCMKCETSSGDERTLLALCCRTSKSSKLKIDGQTQASRNNAEKALRQQHMIDELDWDPATPFLTVLDNQTAVTCIS